jgi:hypothetical protein
MAYTNVPSSSVVCLPSSVLLQESSHPRRPLYQILRSLSSSSNPLQLLRPQGSSPPPFRAPPVPVMDDLLHHYKVPPPASRLTTHLHTTSSLRRHSIGAVIRQTDLTTAAAASDATPLVGPTGTLKGFRRATAAIVEAAEPAETRKIKIKGRTRFFIHHTLLINFAVHLRQKSAQTFFKFMDCAMTKI